MTDQELETAMGASGEVRTQVRLLGHCQPCEE